jgi:hypothetical protein
MANRPSPGGIRDDHWNPRLRGAATSRLHRLRFQS